MSGSDGPAWAPEGRAGLCWMLREQLVETIDAIRRQAAAVVPSAPGLESVGESPASAPRN
ncbi:hypothetical protein [Streptomyces sp. NPDC001500]